MKQSIRSLILFIISTAAVAQQPVVPGDFPDPSVIKFGDAYYATATSSNWAPSFPILKSTDLKTWEQVGYIFPERTEWADYYYWAPELSVDSGKVYVYYTAHKKDGNLCVGVASADQPEGPYTDHGPLVCQEVGSIDGFPVRDENNVMHLIWKEDGNSVGKPTPIWIQPINADRTALEGEKKELFRNDTPWEANLVEGVSIIRNNGYFYAIYAAAGCCGSGCTYATGVARAQKLTGPWEKFAGNPILTSQDNWVCPGHGTAIKHDGKDYFMYHAYDKESNKYTGRQTLLRQFEFTSDGWIQFLPDYITNADSSSYLTSTDDFENAQPDMQWNWSVLRKPLLDLKNGKLSVKMQDKREIYLGHKIYSTNYQATIETVASETSGWAGVGLIGDDKNLIYMAAKKDSIRISALKNGVENSIGKFAVQRGDRNMFLRLTVENNTDLRFYFSTNGVSFVAADAVKVDISYLPPWDRALRTGIVAKGNPGEEAIIEKFVFKAQ